MYNLNRLKDMLVVMEDCVLKLENFNNIYRSIDNVEAILDGAYTSPTLADIRLLDLLLKWQKNKIPPWLFPHVCYNTKAVWSSEHNMGV